MEFTKTLREYSNKIRYFNYSKRTEEIYLHYFEKFLISRSKYPIHLTSEDFEQYLLNYNFSSISQQNQTLVSEKETISEWVLNWIEKNCPMAWYKPMFMI